MRIRRLNKEIQKAIEYDLVDSHDFGIPVCYDIKIMDVELLAGFKWGYQALLKLKRYEDNVGWEGWLERWDSPSIDYTMLKKHGYDVEELLTAYKTALQRSVNEKITAYTGTMPITMSTFQSELTNSIRNEPTFMKLEQDVKDKDASILNLKASFEATMVTINDQGYKIEDQQKLITNLQGELNKYGDHEADIESLKQNLKIFSNDFEPCCIKTAVKLRDGSGRKFCVCGRAVTPEVTAVMERKGVI